MALIGCPECRKNVSQTSVKCVHCGYVFKAGEALRILKQEYKAKVFAYVFLAIVAIVFWIKCL